MIIVETSRLLLRRFKEEDLAAFISYRSDPSVAEYQSWDVPYTKEKALDFWNYQKDLKEDTPDKWQQIAIELKQTNELIGDYAVHTLEDSRQIEIGYTLASQFQKNGYMTEALSALVNHLFTKDKHRISAQLDAKNDRSAKLLERLGFRKEGEFIEDMWFKGRWSSTLQYAILKTEWLNQQKCDLEKYLMPKGPLRRV